MAGINPVTQTDSLSTPNRSRNNRVYRFLREKRIIQNYDLYLLIIPCLVFYAVFMYGPMYGVQLAFKDFKASLGIWGSPWTGLDHFQRFFSSPYFSRLLVNTVSLSGLQLLFGFPIPIILALMVNELKNKRVKKFVQNVTYIPYFLSVIVLVGMLKNFVHLEYGVINTFIDALGGSRIDFIKEAQWFRTLYVGSGIWQSTGWNSIIFIAALSGVDPEMHESAMIEGANRLQRMWYINLPTILPTIVIVLILNVGQLMNIGFEKAFLMQNTLTLSKSDIISTYVYRVGVQGAQYDFSTAIGLFNSAINCTILLLVNTFARKINETSLW